MALNHQQWTMFVGLYISYFMLIYVRKSFSYTSPVVMEEEKLEKNQLGLIISSQMIGYSISKFCGGVLVDSLSPSKMLSTCVFLTGFTGLIFTMFDSVSMFSFIWFLNGLVQGPSWPACAVLLKRWFPADQFGTWWSALSSAINMAGSVGPISTATIVSLIGWRKTMSLAGCIAMAVSCFVIANIADYPVSSTKPHSVKKSDKKSHGKQGSKFYVLLKFIKEPVFVSVCINYMLISVIRGACNDWGQLYLIQDKQQSVLQGSVFTSSQEVGGIMGTIIAGYLSDYLVSKGGRRYNPRLRVALLMVIISALSVYMLLYFTTSTTYQIYTSASGFGIGFGVYGAIALFGVTAMESAPQGLEGTAHSVAALSANIGSILSGYPMSLIAKSYSWHVAFQLIFVLSICTVLIALFSQRPNARRKEYTI